MENVLFELESDYYILYELQQHSSDYYSLHESMHRQNTVAFVRGVLRSATEAPKIGLLYPEVDEKLFFKVFVIHSVV